MRTGKAEKKQAPNWGRGTSRKSHRAKGQVELNHPTWVRSDPGSGHVGEGHAWWHCCPSPLSGKRRVGEALRKSRSSQPAEDSLSLKAGEKVGKAEKRGCHSKSSAARPRSSIKSSKKNRKEAVYRPPWETEFKTGLMNPYGGKRSKKVGG